MQVLVGTSASVGRAIGPVVFLRRNRTSVGRAIGNPAQEARRFERAKEAACAELVALEEKAPEQDKTIFTVQRIMLDDDGLCHEISAYIKAGAGAAASVERAANLYAQRLRAIGDNYMSERACDVLDACQRIVNILDGGENAMPKLTSPAIIISDEIYPTDIMSQNTKNVLAIVTAKGSPNAHASIIARTMGIPAVVQTGDALEKQSSGVCVAVDGTTGEVFVEPDAETMTRFEKLQRRQKRRERELEMINRAPCVTRDGKVVYIHAACVTPDDVRAAVKLGCAGVSMLLSDYLLEARHFDTEDAQYKFYIECIEAAQGLPVSITTYDTSADTSHDSAEAEPRASLRGIRYGLEHPTFFRTQLTALLRASAMGKLSVVFPFVTSADQLSSALAYVEEAKDILYARGESYDAATRFGVRVDTPAAALAVTDLAPQSDFFVFAVRSLIQHAYAVNITDKTDLKYLPPEPGIAPAARQLIEYAMLAADTAKIPYGVGGEWASHKEVAADCVRLGLMHVTVPVALVPEAKEYLAQLDLSKAEK